MSTASPSVAGGRVPKRSESHPARGDVSPITSGGTAISDVDRQIREPEPEVRSERIAPPMAASSRDEEARPEPKRLLS